MAKSRKPPKPKRSSRVPPGLPWSTDADRIALLRPKRFIAGAWTECELAITVKGRPVAEGSRLGLGVPYGFPRPAASDPTAEGDLTAPGPEGVTLGALRLDRGRERNARARREHQSSLRRPERRLARRARAAPGVTRDALALLP